MNGWTTVGIGITVCVLLFVLISRPFDCQHKDTDQLKAERDSLIVKNKFLTGELDFTRYQYQDAVRELVNCKDSLRVRKITVVPKPDNKAHIFVVAALKDSIDGLHRIAGKLQPSSFSDKVNEFGYNDGYVAFGLHAYGTHIPLDGITELHYNLDSYRLLKKQIEYIDREIPVYVSESYFFVGGGTAFSWRTKTFEPFLNVGANLDVGKYVFDFKVLEPRYSFVQKKLDWTSRAELRRKL